MGKCGPWQDRGHMEKRPETNRTDRAIRAKLTSNAGASITFALLVFLVCAMVSAVVLVAATTAAGRMKGIAATDERYYSVTSAAELLKDLLDEKSVSQVTTTAGTSYIEKPMSLVEATDLGKPDPQTLTVYLAKACFEDGRTLNKEELALTGAGPDVIANTTLDKDTGDVTFVLSDPDKKYSLMLVFSADKTDDHPPLPDGDFTGSNQIRWHFSRMISSFDQKELSGE